MADAVNDFADAVNDFRRIGMEIQNVITAVEHDDKNELLSALTKLRNIFYTRAEEAEAAAERLFGIVLGTDTE